MALVFILLVSLVLYFYLSNNAKNKPGSSTGRRIRVHKQQIKPISDADVVGADGDGDDAHIETVQLHEGDEDEDELDLEPQQKQPQPQPGPQRQRGPQPRPQPQSGPFPSSQRGFPIPSQRRPPPASRPPQSVVDNFTPPPAAPPSRGGGIVVERGLPPKEWPNMPTPMPNPFGGFLNGEYPWIGEGYDKLGSFERLHDQLPEHIRKNIELIAGRGNGLEDLFSDDNVHGCSIM